MVRTSFIGARQLGHTNGAGWSLLMGSSYPGSLGRILIWIKRGTARVTAAPRFRTCIPNARGNVGFLTLPAFLAGRQQIGANERSNPADPGDGQAKTRLGAARAGLPRF